MIVAIEMNIEMTSENSKLPEKTTKGAGAYDVYCTEIKEGGHYVDFMLGFRTEIPEGFRAILIPRSSLTKTGWCMPHGQGLIDSDFRGEWRLRLSPLDLRVCEDGSVIKSALPYKVGERVAQFYLERTIDPILNVVSSVGETERDGAGFGTTGK